MKTYMIRLIIIICISFSVLSCDNEEDSQVKEETPILYLKSILGGCNNKNVENIEQDEEKSDTVIITLSNDTLNIFAGLNYICCTPFITDCNIKNDSIFITITDTCSNPYQECYCRCGCYYTFDYFFNSISVNKYYWQIILSDPREENDTILKIGIIEVDK